MLFYVVEKLFPYPNVKKICFLILSSRIFKFWLFAFKFYLLYIYHFFIHLSVDRHLGCFHIWGTINNASLNIRVHVFFQINVFIFWYISKTGIIGSCHSSLFTFFCISPSNEYSGLIAFLKWLVWSPFCPRDSQKSSPAPHFESINSSVLSLLYSPVLYITTGKTMTWTMQTFSDKVMSQVFDTLSRFVIAFLLFFANFICCKYSCIAQLVKHLPAMRETWVQFLGQEVPLEKKMATHSSVLAWKIPGTVKPGGLLSMGSHRARLKRLSSSSKGCCHNGKQYGKSAKKSKKRTTAWSNNSSLGYISEK